MIESLGQRIGRLRTAQGWTQQDIAERVAISRVAISHLESGLSVPSERTITLLAGLFKLEPHELVANTSYPESKAERLALVACRYTEVELQLALLERDIAWLRRIIDTEDYTTFIRQARDQWALKIEQLGQGSLDLRERGLLVKARELLEQLQP